MTIMPTQFYLAFKYLIHNEGTVFTNNPNDSGGPTKFGVTKRAWESYVGAPVEVSVIENLTEDQAQDFYYARYWRPLSCGRLSQLGIAICIFDTGVLYGVGSSAILAQKAASLCGANLKFDGQIGDISVKALNIVKQEEFLTHFHTLILERIESIISLNPADETFRRGWNSRAGRLLTLKDIDPLINHVT